MSSKFTARPGQMSQIFLVAEKEEDSRATICKFILA